MLQPEIVEIYLRSKSKFVGVVDAIRKKEDRTILIEMFSQKIFLKFSTVANIRNSTFHLEHHSG